MLRHCQIWVAAYLHDIQWTRCCIFNGNRNLDFILDRICWNLFLQAFCTQHYIRSSCGEMFATEDTRCLFWYIPPPTHTHTHIHIHVHIPGTVDWEIFLVKIFVQFIFALFNFCHWAFILTSTKHIECIALLLRLPKKNPVLLQLYHADCHTYQQQTAERACTCKYHAYLQPCFELPSALTNCFSDCYGRYSRR